MFQSGNLGGNKYINETIELKCNKGLQLPAKFWGKPQNNKETIVWRSMKFKCSWDNQSESPRSPKWEPETANFPYCVPKTCIITELYNVSVSINVSESVSYNCTDGRQRNVSCEDQSDVPDGTAIKFPLGHCRGALKQNFLFIYSTIQCIIEHIKFNLNFI